MGRGGGGGEGGGGGVWMLASSLTFVENGARSMKSRWLFSVFFCFCGVGVKCVGLTRV